MPLAGAKTAAPAVVAPSKVEAVGGQSASELRETSRIQGQIRTHLVAHAMPSLMSTIDLSDATKVKALINEYTKFVETGA